MTNEPIKVDPVAPSSNDGAEYSRVRAYALSLTRNAAEADDLERFSVAEIATLLDASIPTIKSRLHRARARLRAP